MGIDDVVLRTGETVPEPVIYPIFIKLSELPQSQLNALAEVAHGQKEAWRISAYTLLMLQRAELINADETIDSTIAKVTKASTEAYKDSYRLIHPINFPMRELTSRSRVD